MRLALVLLLALLVFGVGGASAVTPWPPAPTNLRVSDVTEDSVTVHWGPTVVEGFGVLSVGKNKVTITWNPAQDDDGIDHYTISRPDGTVLGTTTTNAYVVTVQPRLAEFHICVRATNSLGQEGPLGCGTYTR